MEMISIIIAVYNIENYLGRCIESVINQTYKDLEIIIVNDGSTDKSGELCDMIAKQDARITVYHTKHRGLAHARNYGLQRTSGIYVGFVDGDDYIAIDMYEKLAVNMDEGIDVVCCGRRCINPSGVKNYNYCCLDSMKRFSSKEAIREVLLLRSISFSVCTKLFRKELFDDIKFPDGKTSEDIPTTYAILKKCRNLVHIGSAKYFNCFRENSESRRDFFEGKIVSVLFARDILRDVMINYPEYEKEAEARYVKNALVVLQCINKSDNADQFRKIQKRLQKFLRRMIGRELVNPYIPKVYKEILLRNAVFCMNAEDYKRI